jgi:hypothetical protein
MGNPKFTLIPFRDQEILSNKSYIVPKQICENLGISWSGQFERMKRDTVLNDAIRVIRIPKKSIKIKKANQRQIVTG